MRCGGQAFKIADMLFVRNVADGHLSPVPLQLSSADHALFNDYVSAVERAEATSGFDKSPKRADFVSDPNEGRSVKWAPKLTSDEQDLLLYRLRPLILQEEPFSFIKTASRAGSSLPHIAIRNFIRGERSRFSGERWRQMWQISSGDIVLNSEDMFKKWLNALEYHRDPDKRRQIEKLNNESLPGLFPWVRSGMLFEKIEAVANLARLLRVVLGSANSFQFSDWVVERGGSGA